MNNLNPVEMSDQDIAFNKYLNRSNIFLSGPAGSGKSYLINKIVNHANENGINIAVTAMTGCAAMLLNCGAKTLHSWAGIGLANLPDHEIINNIRSSPNKKKNWKKPSILIIDEVSMMSRRLFELLNLIGCMIRPNIHPYTREPINTNLSHIDKPFGGLQVIFVGDFHQLPPICISNNKNDHNSQFCFESPLWENVFSINNHIILSKSYRHEIDIRFSKLLNQLRIGTLSHKSLDLLLTCINRKIPDDIEFNPTVLSPINKEVNFININEFNKINEPTYEYNINIYNSRLCIELDYNNYKSDIISHNKFTYEEKNDIEYLIGSMQCDKIIKLKKGTHVMCIINLPDMSLVNGSQGIIIDFENIPNSNLPPIPIVKFTNGIIKSMSSFSWQKEKNSTVCIKQLPIIYAWAITIHRSQGKTLDMAKINAGSDIFEDGQTYVALSRIRSISGLYLTAFDPSKIKVNNKVLKFYENIKNNQIQQI